ncbi:helix-turn-helix domain-containing protein [Rhodoplanes serenus]|uniref:Helix-turn-helix domain-containing protein n=1 Tax=Rhodoplanes serenus TaxID=200615 RepID=A0A9X4XR75_9BRAD|nr:helix-turn-helix domain-containing protein [Rhodoplanes serenus]MTW19327.1 helix-turn-helix domain-containing protein [Rhodoplanes serenus]
MPERHRSHRQPNSIAASDAWDHLAGDDASRVDPRAFGLLKATYSVAETLELLSVGRTSLYAAVKRGDLTPIKFGRKTLFCAMDLAAFLIRLKDEAAVSHTLGFRRRRV